jgi:hypothetical protein
MGNTLTTMQARIFADSAISKFNQFLAPINAFSTGFNAEAARKGDTIRVPVFPTATAGAFGGDYSGTDQTITGVDISLNQHVFYSVAFTDRELAESPADYFGGMGAQLGKAVARKVLETVMADITAANFGNAAGDKLVVAEASFAATSVTSIRQKLAAKGIPANDAALVLSIGNYASLLNSNNVLAYAIGNNDAVTKGEINGIYGFGKAIESNIIPSNSENLTGFACAKQAIGVGMRYLAPQSTAALIDAGMVSDEASGVTLGIRVIPDQLHGKVHYAVEALFGSAKTDGDSLVRILSA